MEIEGKVTCWHTLRLTDNAATTGRINMDGFAFGRIIKESVGDLEITYYDAETATSTAYPAGGEDSATAATQTLSGAGSRPLPMSLAGCTMLTPVLSTGTGTVRVKLCR